MYYNFKNKAKIDVLINRNFKNRDAILYLQAKYCRVLELVDKPSGLGGGDHGINPACRGQLLRGGSSPPPTALTPEVRLRISGVIFLPYASDRLRYL